VVTVRKSRLVQRVARHPERHQQDTQENGQLLNPGAKPQDFLLQPKGIHVENIDGNDFGVCFRQPATSRRPRDASLDGAIEVACRPAEVRLVVHSGEADEFTLPADVLGVDRENDLGLLRVKGRAARLPEPLPVDTSRAVGLLQKVYIFGFPFGTSLGKDITASESSISSIRKDAAGSATQIQVNGGMHGGNSGPPEQAPARADRPRHSTQQSQLVAPLPTLHRGGGSR